LYAGGYDIDADYGIQRKSNDVLIIIDDTRKQQLTITKFSLLFVLGYTTRMNEGLPFLICMVVMARENRHGGGLQKPAGHGDLYGGTV
jgi:hypothetical protein